MVLKSRDISLAVVIPMLNEERGVDKCVETVVKILPTLPVKAQLYVVNDGSTDKTPELLNKLTKKHPRWLSVLHHTRNLGYGAGLQTGARQAQADGYAYCAFMDSDLTNDPADLPRFISKLKESGADVVKATRYSAGGGPKGVPFKRVIVSVVGNWIARMCFRMGIHDYTNGFRIVRSNLIASIDYKEKGFASIMEEMYNLKKMKAYCVELPVVLTSRIDTDTHFRYTFKQFWNYLKYPLKACLIF